MKKHISLLVIVGAIFWIAGYFIPIDPIDADPNTFYSGFGWSGMPVYLTPFFLTLFLLNKGAEKTAFILSVILFLSVTALFLSALWLGSFDPKSGEYRVVENLGQLQQEPGWLALFLSSSLLIVSTRHCNTKQTNRTRQ